eukprot:3322371-Rhodomonas_salina.1
MEREKKKQNERQQENQQKEEAVEEEREEEEEEDGRTLRFGSSSVPEQVRPLKNSGLSHGSITCEIP